MDGDRILVAVDGSPPAMAAARMAFDLAGRTGGTVRLLGVVGDEHTGAPIDRVAAVPDAAADRRESDLRSAVDYTVNIGQSLGVEVESTIRTTAHSGEAFEEILSEADDWHATWIFMGRTSAHGPGRVLLGSQTEHVLEFSPVPVVVVPAAETPRH
jgi:nucleotide-binding universal stress UspA family protein